MNQEDDDSLIDLTAVMKIVGLSKSEIFRRVDSGTFPNRIKLGARCSRWSKNEVTRWAYEWLAKRGSPQQATMKVRYPLQRNAAPVPNGNAEPSERHRADNHAESALPGNGNTPTEREPSADLSGKPGTEARHEINAGTNGDSRYPNSPVRREGEIPAPATHNAPSRMLQLINSWTNEVGDIDRFNQVVALCWELERDLAHCDDAWRQERHLRRQITLSSGDGYIAPVDKKSLKGTPR